MMRRSQNNNSSQTYASDNSSQFASDSADQGAAPTPDSPRANFASYELPAGDSSLCDQQEPALLSSSSAQSRSANRQMQSIRGGVRQASASSASDPYNPNSYPTSQQALQQQTYQPRSNQYAQLPQPQPLSSNPMNGWAGDVTMRSYLQNNPQARMPSGAQHAQAYGSANQTSSQSNSSSAQSNSPAKAPRAVQVSQNTASDNTPREVPEATPVAAESSGSDYGSCSQCSNGSCSSCSCDHCGCSDCGHDSCGCNDCDDDHCCCDDCCWTPCGCPGWFAGADYLFVRPDFSNAPAFQRITAVSGTQPTITQTFTTIQQNFSYESSVRAFFGYRTECGDEIRFTYWNFNQDSTATVNAGVDVAYGGQFMLRANEPGDSLTNQVSLNMNVYDIDYVKCCCNPCGCQSPCCPVWTLSYSAGIRIASVNRTDNTLQDSPSVDPALPVAGFITANFIGAGPRLGLEGRRFFLNHDRLSLFARGHLALLLGEYDVTQNVLVTSPTSAVTRLVNNHDRIIPEADIEIGGDWQVTCRLRLSAGYLFQAWWDLGEFEFISPSTSSGLIPDVNNANILGFDGLFARVEYRF